MSGNELIGKSARASTFLNSLGVNTQGNTYVDAYKNSSLVINSLKYLGIDSVRDTYTPYGQANPILDAMASAGIKFDFRVSSTLPAMGATGLASFISSLKTFQAEQPGSILSIEGLNEINLFSFSYNGVSTAAGAAAFQQALYNAVKADPALSKVGVLNLTVANDSTTVYNALGDLGKYSDYANVHAYPQTGGLGDPQIEASINLAKGASKGDPIIVTETGYSTLPLTMGVGASEMAQAKLILNNLFDAFEDGSVKTYMYTLFNTPSVADVRGEKEAHFGLFNGDGSPKLAATAVHNLTTILSFGDTGATTTPGSLNYSFGAVPANTHSMLFTKSGGVQDLVVWTEKRVWNETTQQNISNPAVSVAVNFGKVESTVRVYDPLLGLTPIATYTNVSSIKIPLSDHPLIIELGAKSAVSVPVETVTANLSMTAAQLVARIDSLDDAVGLKTVMLTDSHTLAVSSLETMNYMITHYQGVLDKISGGHKFSFTYGDDTWRKTQLFDDSGNKISETDYGLSKGVVVSKAVYTVNGGQDYYAYYITGKTYTTEHQIMDAKGRLIGLERWHANGTLDYTESKPIGGDKHYVFYDALGHKLNDVTIEVDGTTTTLTFNAATGKLSRRIIDEADGDHFTTTYTNGVRTNVVATYKTATVETIAYDTSGKILGDTIKGHDGHTTTKLYTDGVLMKYYDKHSPGNQDNYFYHIAGETYTTEHQIINAAGVTMGIERWHANGTRDYRDIKGADGSRDITDYTATGSVLSHVLINPNGSRVVDTYLQDGSGDVRHAVYNTNTVALRTDTVHKDGTHTLYALADGQNLRGGAGSDDFHFEGAEDGRLIYDGGNDIAYNFNAKGINPEHLIIDTSWAANFSELHMAQKGSDVLITFDSHNSILLTATQLANVGADSFMFV